MKAFLLASCMAVSFVMADGSVSGAESGGAKALQTMGDASEKEIAEQVKAFQKEDALQRDAKDAYDELMDVVEDSAAVEKNYAGAYINDDNQLVVNLTTSSEKVQDIVQDGTESQKVEFHRKKYTYEELKEVSDQIGDAIAGTKYIDVVSSVGVNEIDNAVEVAMTDLSYEEGFRREICNHECIRFNKTMYESEPAKTDLKPGGYIGNASGGYSIGWRGWRINNAGNYTEGLVTAGHGNRVNDKALTYSGGNFGKFVKRRFGGNLDTTFVQKTNQNYGVSNTIKFSGSSLIAGYHVRSSNICVGQKVHKVGMTTGLTSGKILDRSYKVTYPEYDGNPDTVFTDFVKTDFYGYAGDSGGLIYMDMNGAYRIVGNLASYRKSNKQGDSICTFVKADNIINQMEIYPY